MSHDEVKKDLLFSRNDPQDPRLGECVVPVSKISDIVEGAFVIAGYPDDEGIKLNGGRPGAAEAPDRIRKILYKMTPSLSRSHANPKIFDCGNLKKDAVLSRRHELARETVLEILSKDRRLVTIGGGHDYGFPDMAAFCDHVLKQGKRPAVINFDAHLDVRPDTNGPSSGTPFYFLMKEFSGRVDFFAVGIQDWCNSRPHLSWLQERGGQVFTLEEIHASSLTIEEFVSQKILSRLTRDHRLALSVDIDGFASSAAPGASQVFPIGIDATDFLNLWKVMVKRLRPALAGFYEVSPPLDLDDRTSRLAAILIHQFMHSSF